MQRGRAREVTMVLLSALVGCMGWGEGANRLVSSVSQSMDAAGVDALDVTNEGPVTVRGEQSNEIVVDFELWSSHENDDHDADANRAFHVELRELDVATAQATAWLEDDASDDGYWAAISVRMPPRIGVSADIDEGDVDIERVGFLALIQGSGDVSVREVGGYVSIDDEEGDLDIDGVGGDADVHDGSGDLTVRNVDGDLDLWDGSGDIVIGEVGGTTEVHESGSGGLTIE
jgi:hypothetical protein